MYLFWTSKSVSQKPEELHRVLVRRYLGRSFRHVAVHHGQIATCSNAVRTAAFVHIAAGADNAD